MGKNILYLEEFYKDYQEIALEETLLGIEAIQEIVFELAKDCDLFACFGVGVRAELTKTNKDEGFLFGCYPNPSDIDRPYEVIYYKKDDTR